MNELADVLAWWLHEVSRDPLRLSYKLRILLAHTAFVLIVGGAGLAAWLIPKWLTP